MTQATDIIKQIQEALEFYADEIRHARVHRCADSHGEFLGNDITFGKGNRSKKALKLIPSLLEHAEKWEKGVSLSECAESLFEESTGRVGQWNNLHPAIQESYVDGAKAVLDKAGVPYAE